VHVAQRNNSCFFTRHAKRVNALHEQNAVFAVTQCGTHTNHEAFKGLQPLLLNHPRINYPHSLNQYSPWSPYSVVKQHQSHSKPFQCRPM